MINMYLSEAYKERKSLKVMKLCYFENTCFKVILVTSTLTDYALRKFGLQICSG